MKNIYKNFIKDLDNNKPTTLKTIKEFTKDIIDLQDLSKYIVNIVETTDNNVIAQYNHANKTIEYNINKINSYILSGKKNLSDRDKNFHSLLTNLSTIRHEIRHAEQNKNYYELIDPLSRYIYVDCMSNQGVYDKMHDLCPLEVDANLEGLLETNKFFKATNNVNGELDEEIAKKYILTNMLDLYKRDGELISPAYLYYLALGHERRYFILRALLKTDEQRLRNGIDISYKLIDELKKAEDINSFIKRR